MIYLRSALLGIALLAQGALAQTGPLNSGRTTIALDANTVSVLTALKVQISTAGLGRLSGTSLSFPVTVGTLDTATLLGEVFHAGALVITAGSTTVQLWNFTIDTTGISPKLTALAVVNGSSVGRIGVFDLALPAGLTPPVTPLGGALVSVPGVAVTLSADGAAALNQSFGVTVFSAGLPIGTASVKALIDADYITGM